MSHKAVKVKVGGDAITNRLLRLTDLCHVECPSTCEETRLHFHIQSSHLYRSDLAGTGLEMTEKMEINIFKTNTSSFLS